MADAPRAAMGYAGALASLLDRAAGIGRVPEESVPLVLATGRVLREPIVADCDLPPFDRAQMDGYAVRHNEAVAGRPMPVAGSVAAGGVWSGSAPPGACVAVATGAPVPPGFDTVIEHERSDRGDPVRFSSVPPRGSAIHPRGADAAAGATLVAAGTVLRAHHVGLAATAGKAVLRVARRPRAALLTSGDEVAPIGGPRRPHQIRDGNGPMLAALVETMGAEPGSRRHVRDDLSETLRALEEALAACDVAVTVGGVSAGERDFVPEALRRLGAEVVFSGAALQPGGPLTASTLGGAVVLSLPGNPVSALVCAHLFLWPLLRQLAGADPTLPWRAASLAAPVRPNARRQAFRPARFGADGRVTVPSWAGSGDLAHTAQTDGLVELPLQEEEVRAGTVVRALPWAGRAG